MSKRQNIISEWLKKPFYSDEQAKQNQAMSKSSSQTSTDKNIEVGHINYDPFSSYVNQALGGDTNMALIKAEEINAQIMRWREVSHYPEVDEAISEIANEAIVYDEIDDPIEINLDDVEVSDGIKDKVTEIFQKHLYMLDFGKNGDDLFRQWYVDGQINIECVFDNTGLKKGIQKLVLLTPFNLFKIKQVQNNQIYYFYSNNPSFDRNKDFKNSKEIFKDEQLIRVVSGIWSIDKKAPLSLLQKAIKSINQLYLIEDSLVIYRITHAPEKRVFYIDTGRLPKSKAEEYVQSLIRKYRQKKVYDVQLGDIKNKQKSISILEDFWFPTSSDGRGTKVDVLQGMNTNFGEMSDVNYFVEKVYKALHVPSSRRSKENDNRVVIQNTVDIERAELKFWKFIQKLRKRFNELFIELLKRDLLAQKIVTVEEWGTIKDKIKFKYSNSNEFSMIKKLQTIEMRMSIATQASGLREDKILSREYVMKEIMMFSDKEISEIKKQLKKESEEDKADTDVADQLGAEDNARLLPEPEEEKESEKLKAKKKQEKDQTDESLNADSICSAREVLKE